MFAKRLFASVSLLTLAMAVLAANAGSCTAQAQSAPNLSGTWELVEYGGVKQKNLGDKFPKLTLVISQEGSQIRITQKRIKRGTETVQEYTYYTDGRGETNTGRPELWGPDPRGFESVSSWQKEKLVTKYDVKVDLGTGKGGVSALKSPSYYTVNTAARRNDEWRLGSEGKTLVLTSSYLGINSGPITTGGIPDPRLNNNGAEGDRMASYAGFSKSKCVFRRI